jgi:DNA-directed RNA polymerase specialized sigma24 family protein
VSDLPYAEVGAVMGCSEEAARRSAFEGLRRLREVMA